MMHVVVEGQAPSRGFAAIAQNGIPFSAIFERESAYSRSHAHCAVFHFSGFVCMLLAFTAARGAFHSGFETTTHSTPKQYAPVQKHRT
jgi:hypothetical protein